MSRVKRFYLIISISFISLVVIIMALGVFSFIKIMNIKNNILYQDNYLEMLNKKKVKLVELEKGFEEAKNNAEIINSTLPAEKDASKLISDLSSLTRSSGLTFN